MGTTRRVSVPALRILTYTILIKAAISAVMLMCSTAAGIVLRSGAGEIPGLGSLYVTAETADFINIVACVMCLGGIASLSKQFITTQRIMVSVLIIDCFILLPITAGLYLTIINNTAASSVMNIIMLTMVAAEKLLIGTAFLFLMKGFGEGLRENGDNGSAAAGERLSLIYLCCSAAVVAVIGIGSMRGDPFIGAEATLSLAGVILEILMFIRAYDDAQQIWKKRAFSDPE